MGYQYSTPLLHSRERGGTDSSHPSHPCCRLAGWAGRTGEGATGKKQKRLSCLVTDFYLKLPQYPDIPGSPSVTPLKTGHSTSSLMCPSGWMEVGATQVGFSSFFLSLDNVPPWSWDWTLQTAQGVIAGAACRGVAGEAQ